MSNIKRALVISGGGAKGAWGGGTIQGLYEKYNYDYDLVVATSTGSLLMNLVATKQMDRLKELYTSVNQKSIFKWNPFNAKGKIHKLKALWRILTGKSTLGDSSNLHKLMKESFSIQDYLELQKSNVEIVASVTNISTKEIEYKSSLVNTYDDMLEWEYASACVPVFMSIVKKNGFEYVDGGVMEHIPIQYAIDNDVDVIDIIVHRPEDQLSDDYNTSSVIELFEKVIDTMLKEVSRNDISMSKLEASDKDIELNFYFTPFNLTKNSLMFDKKIMNDWWELGYSDIMENNMDMACFKMTCSGEIKKIK